MIQIFPLTDEAPERGARMKRLSFHQVSELQQGRLTGTARWLSVPEARPKQRVPGRIGERLEPRSQPARPRACSIMFPQSLAVPYPNGPLQGLLCLDRDVASPQGLELRA